jgi:hypothetical protein
MRIFRIIVLAGLASMLMTQAGSAFTTIFDWQGNGRSEVFTVERKIGSWRAVWECEAHTSPTIAILNADSGVPIDFLGASYRGERLVSKTGRFQLDTRGAFCRVTAMTLN